MQRLVFALQLLQAQRHDGVPGVQQRFLPLLRFALAFGGEVPDAGGGVCGVRLHSQHVLFSVVFSWDRERKGGVGGKWERTQAQRDTLTEVLHQALVVDGDDAGWRTVLRQAGGRGVHR